MNLTRWQPANTVWNQLQQLQQEMNQLFSRWGDDGGAGWAFPAASRRSTSGKMEIRSMWKRNCPDSI